ncbi:3-phosphoshikimate 1-carboxyvinyltransferase [Salicibibacter halophilus]|uniref:3-phosphoshikimate 1-carboxyvinyltransferase n=1 Tax=Salicibibacter halophilus TaxID=2502791 RepID=A0A514LEH5_9BACI|nr:3-phosphoshikimate 1-carboxyvinyltransferase [Salicibibacter halophilus]QDI89965.1 3-phosphoshikimate 1-carboxyvinyltransferase [Salicibibacter halophilus]
MDKETITASKALRGSITVPGDKSISHRAVMFGAIASGQTTVHGFLDGEDCRQTIACFQKMGVAIHYDRDKHMVVIDGEGIDGLEEPSELLDVGNSGTTIRLMLGILVGRPYFSVVAGDESIEKRPMARITEPLRSMGAQIHGRRNGTYTPIAIPDGENTLTGIEYQLPVASAQVKSAILLAGLQAQGKTTVREKYRSRDHTERMLQAFGVDVDVSANEVSISGGQPLQAREVHVPGDISSAAFMLAAAAIVKDSCLRIDNVGVNPTRTGFIDALVAMGGEVAFENERVRGGEPVADIVIREKSLHATAISGSLIPRLIDEIPVLAVIATQAIGRTVIKDASELKFKETNRIDATASQLRQMGADVQATEDGFIIDGPTPLTGAEVSSFNDHRIGMAFTIAALIAEGETTIHGAKASAISFPEFYQSLRALSDS